MSKMFDMNNPVWQFIGKLVDATVLNICWFVCSLPIVTFGASTAALHYALMKDVADEETHYVRAFFKSFKQNLKQGIGLGLIVLVVGALLVFACRFYSTMPGTFWGIVRGVAIACLILYVMTLQYVFALFARFDNKTSKLFVNAFFLSIRHIGWTVLMIFFFAAVVFVIFFMNFLPLILIGYGLVVYLNAYVLNHVLQPYLDLASGNDVNEDPDSWTIPEDETAEETVSEETAVLTAEEAPAAEEAAEEAEDTTERN